MTPERKAELRRLCDRRLPSELQKALCECLDALDVRDRRWADGRGHWNDVLEQRDLRIEALEDNVATLREELAGRDRRVADKWSDLIERMIPYVHDHDGRCTEQGEREMFKLAADLRAAGFDVPADEDLI